MILAREQDVDSTVTAPASSLKHPRPLESSEESSPSPKRQHLSRTKALGQKCVNYDMKHHPMDDVLRPTAAAKRRIRFQTVQGLVNDDFHHLSGGNDSRLLDQEGIIGDDYSKPDTQSRVPNPVIDEDITTPDRRRSTRANKFGGKAVDYDMRHHPMDDILRPKAAAKRSLWFDCNSSPETLPKAAPEMLLSIMDDVPINLLTKTTSSDWNSLEPFDRRIYMLQKGAPVSGSALPRQWSEVVKILVEEDYLTRVQLKTWGGVKALALRYESVRLGVEQFFNAEPESTDKEDWQVMHIEGLDIHRKAKGERYWPRTCNSPVVPISSKVKEHTNMNSTDADDEMQPRGRESALTIPDTDHAESSASSASYDDVVEDDLMENMHDLMENMRNELAVDMQAMEVMSNQELDEFLSQLTSDSSPTSITEPVLAIGSFASQFSEDTVNPAVTQIANNRSAKSTGNPPTGATAGLDTSLGSVLVEDQEMIDNYTPIEIITRASVLETAHRLATAIEKERHASPPTQSHLFNGAQAYFTPVNAVDSPFPSTTVPPSPTALLANPISKKAWRRRARAKSADLTFRVYEDLHSPVEMPSRKLPDHIIDLTRTNAPWTPGLTDIMKENYEHETDEAILARTVPVDPRPFTPVTPGLI